MAKKRSPKVNATKAEPTAKAVRLDLSPVEHERLHRLAGMLALSKSAFARLAVIRAMDEEEARRKGR